MNNETSRFGMVRYTEPLTDINLETERISKIKELLREEVRTSIPLRIDDSLYPDWMILCRHPMSDLYDKPIYLSADILVNKKYNRFFLLDLMWDNPLKSGDFRYFNYFGFDESYMQKLEHAVAASEYCGIGFINGVIPLNSIIDSAFGQSYGTKEAALDDIVDKYFDAVKAFDENRKKTALYMERALNEAKLHHEYNKELENLPILPGASLYVMHKNFMGKEADTVHIIDYFDSADGCMAVIKLIKSGVAEIITVPIDQIDISNNVFIGKEADKIHIIGRKL